MAAYMKSKEFVSIIKQLLNSKTDYVLGAFGSPLSDKLKYTTGYGVSSTKYSTREYWIQHNKKWNPNDAHTFAVLNATTNENTFVMDCSGLVQAGLCRWNGNTNDCNGGCNTSLLPDRYNARTFASFTEFGNSGYRVFTTDEWSRLTPGEVLWQYDTKTKTYIAHIAVYIGGGVCVECAYNWYAAANMTNGVQSFNIYPLENNEIRGCVSRRNNGAERFWQGHGKLKFIDYSDSEEDVFVNEPEEDIPEFKKGEKVIINSDVNTWASGSNILGTVKNKVFYVYSDSDSKTKTVRITLDSTLKAVTGNISVYDITKYVEPETAQKTETVIKVDVEAQITNEVNFKKDLNTLIKLLKEIKSTESKIYNEPVNKIESSLATVGTKLSKAINLSSELLRYLK